MVERGVTKCIYETDGKAAKYVLHMMSEEEWGIALGDRMGADGRDYWLR